MLNTATMENYSRPSSSRNMHNSQSPPSSVSIPLLNLQEPSTSSSGRLSDSSYSSLNPIYGSRSLNRLNAMIPSNFERHADKIVEKLEREDELMEDTPLAEALRIEALRELPQSMTMKRCVKSKLSKSISQKSKRRPISCWKGLKYRISMATSRFRDSFSDLAFFQLWHGTLKSIEGHFGSGYAAYFKYLRWIFILNCCTAILPILFIIVPQILYDIDTSYNNNASFHFKDIFIGDGYFSETILYYGHYTNKSINLISNSYYNMPIAYFTTNLVIYVLSLLILSISVAKSYRRNFIETEGGLKNVYANKIFCGWDYSIATSEAAKLKSSAIYNELKELLNESARLYTRLRRSCFDTFAAWILYVVSNIIIIFILAGTGYAMWKLLERYARDQGDAIVITAIVANVVILIYPSVFTYIAKYEDYSNPRVALYISLARTFVLGFVIIGIVLAFWLSRADYDHILCWETSLGQEVYRLIIFDFIFSILINTIIEIGYYLILKLAGKEAKVEFNVAKHCLVLNYNQALFWVGLFYSPVLPIVVIIKTLIMWYLRAITLKRMCRPPTRIWKAAQTQTWFLVMTFLTILLVIGVHGYTIKSISVSGSCGPMRDYKYSYDIILYAFSDLQSSSEFWRVVLFLTKPGAIALMMIALCVVVYYTREKALAEIERVRMLRELLLWEQQDKKYLQSNADRITQGQFTKQSYKNRLLDPALIHTSGDNNFGSSGDYDVIHGPQDDLSRYKKYE